jgi:uncharacterized protein (DUF885 family)
MIRIALLLVLAPSVAHASASEDLHQVVEEYFDRSMAMNPVYATYNGDHRFNDRLENSIGPEHRAASEALQRKYLEKIEAIDPAGLGEQDRLSWEIFRRERIHALEGMQFPAHLMPINQMFSLPIFFVQLGSPGGMTPFATVQDYENWLGRIDGFEVWMDQAIANMREGMEQGIVLPGIIVDKTLPILESQVVEDPTTSGFYRVVEAMPEDFDEETRARLAEDYTAAISEKIVPAFERLADFLRDEYRPAARESIALTALPGGAPWYEHQIATHTNTRLTAAEIHEIGLAEVARIEGEMRELAGDVGFEGDLGAMRAWMRQQPELRYESEEDLLESYRALSEVVEPHLPELFGRIPEADFEIRPVEAFRQATTPGAHYMRPTPDGSRPGIFYVNTGGWENRTRAGSEALFIHEAIPGHHFQVALAGELGELPRFRRFGGYTAYIEGWGLYAEQLGTQVGLYRDPYQRLGQLGSELFRARRLVVDTGIHALGWTRDEALAYLGSEVEIDRYIVMPGQALAYKIGELKIVELRDRAEERLGDDFDLRAFHDEILTDGALPLDVLEAKLDGWIDAQAGD